MRACTLALALLASAVLALGALAWDRHGRLTASRTIADTYLRALEQQTSQVRQWRAEAEQQKARSEAAEAQATRIGSEAYARALATLQAAVVPSTCEGAMEWQADFGQEFAKRWEAGR